MLRTCAFLGLGFLAITLATSPGHSQDDKAKGFLPAGWKGLNLSAEQKSKIYTIQKEYKAKYQDLEDKKADLKTKEKSDLVKILTEEQKQQLAKIALGEKTTTPKDKKTDGKEKDKTPSKDTK